MKRFIRSQLERRTPALFAAIRAIRNRRTFRRNFARFQDSVRAGLFLNGAPVAVLTGPFRGLRYLDEIVWGSITPKWLGSYEAELHPVIEEVVGRRYPAIVDVGCAEGYYAVGLAAALPATRVFAFDADFLSRRQTQRLARLNGVADRVEIRSFCHHSDLEALTGGGTLVICDIEGHEAELLDPGKAPCLRRTDILVEVHESSSASRAMEELLISRFTPSHRIHRVPAVDRNAWTGEHAARLPPGLPPDLLRQAAQEHRSPGQAWLWMRAHPA